MRAPSIWLLRGLTLVSLLLTAVVWLLHYSLLICEPEQEGVYLGRVKLHNASNTNGIFRWFKSSLSSHNITSVHSSCSPAHSLPNDGLTLVAMGTIHLPLADQSMDTHPPLHATFSYIGEVDAVVSSLTSAVASTDQSAANALQSLRSLGLKLVSLANVPLHLAGDTARHSTMMALEAAAIRWLGVRVKQHEVVMVRGEKVGFLAFCAVYGHCTDSSTLPYAPMKYSAKAASSAVEKLREHGVSIIIVMVAWGRGTGLFPDETSVGVARHLAELGVSLVLGYSPTPAQGHAYFGQTLVVFSMGVALSPKQEVQTCWVPSQDPSRGWGYADSAGQCEHIHHSVRGSLRAREQLTRLYRVRVGRSGVAVAEYMSLRLQTTGPVVSPGPVDDPPQWTVACGHSDSHCHSCTSF